MFHFYIYLEYREFTEKQELYFLKIFRDILFSEISESNSNSDELYIYFEIYGKRFESYIT